MTSLPRIQNKLREQLSELCEACFAEQEWLEEGRFFDANEGLSGNGKLPGSEEIKSADAA